MDIFDALYEIKPEGPTVTAQCLIITEILRNYGLRISEVLKISKSDLLKNFRIRIHISKSTEINIIRDSDLWYKINHFFKCSNLDKFNIRYINYYRWLLKNFPSLATPPRPVNRAVTHSFRIKIANQIKEETNQTELIKNVLHHKSKNSQKYYLKKYNTCKLKK